MKTENKEQIKDGVVSIFDPKDFEIEWKDIPGFSKYQASNIGLIRNKNNPYPSKIYKIRNHYNGSYLGVSSVSDNKIIKGTSIHQLVCLAFHGMAPISGVNYLVNHIDGNKHNNLPSNLEWATPSENMYHAYRTGLKKDNTPVIVEDQELGDILNFYSISEFGRFFDMDYSKAGRVITQYRNGRLFKDRYVITLDMSNNKPRNQNWVREIKAKDYKNDKIYLTSESRTLEILSDINRATILYRLRNNDKSLLGGWVFMYQDDLESFPVFTLEEIDKSKNDHFTRKVSKERQYGISVKNYLTNEIVNYESILSAAVGTDIVKGTINYFLSLKEYKLFKGLVFKYTDDKRPWPNYSQEKIDMSVLIKKPEFPTARVTDLESNTTKLYPCVAEFARQVGENPKSVANWVKQNPQRPYKSKWKIVKEFL